MIRLQAVPIVRWQLGNVGFNPIHHRLADGILSAPAISPAATAVLQGGVDQIISSINTEIQALVVEADLVSPAAIRVDPSSPSDISYIGNFPPQEIRSAIQTAGQGLSDRVSRVTTGALSSYLTSDQASRLSTLKAQADQVVSAIQNQDTTPISPGDQAAVESYLAMHQKGPDSAIASAEKAVVTAEAGSIPVLEPSEKDIALKIAIGVGLVGVTGFVLWQVLG